MKNWLFGVLAFSLPLCTLAVDADGFFYARPAASEFGERGTSEKKNGALEAVFKIEEGMLKVCLNKQGNSKECSEQWLPPSVAVEKLVKNSCYLGFDQMMGDLVFYYRVNRPCS